MRLHVSCRTCIFFSETFRKPEVGQCRAHAPKLMLTEEGPRTQWPIVQARAGCGDHSTYEEDDRG